MKTFALASLTLLLCGCATVLVTETFYSPSDALGEVWRETEIPTVMHQWPSGAEMVIYMRTVDGSADLLFQLTLPVGTKVYCPDLAARVKVGEREPKTIRTSYLRRVDFTSNANGDYDVLYRDLDTIDGAVGATLLRSHAWKFRRLSSILEWQFVADVNSAKQFVLELPAITVDDVSFAPPPVVFDLVTREVKHFPAY